MNMYKELEQINQTLTAFLLDRIDRYEANGEIVSILMAAYNAGVRATLTQEKE